MGSVVMRVIKQRALHKKAVHDAKARERGGEVKERKEIRIKTPENHTNFEYENNKCEPRWWDTIGKVTEIKLSSLRYNMMLVICMTWLTEKEKKKLVNEVKIRPIYSCFGCDSLDFFPSRTGIIFFLFDSVLFSSV